MALTRLRNQSASIITSGTFADGRIAASNVSQHATSFDDNKIVNDISTLALREASNNNRAAYNTNSSYVDVFQDATGIDTTTSVLRNASEYVSTNQVVDNTVAPDAVDFYIGQGTCILNTTISGSNDNSSYTQLTTDTGFSYPNANGRTSEITWTNSTAYRYLKIVWGANSADFPLMWDIRFKDGGSVIDLSNATASTTTPFWPNTASGNKDIQNAIDGDPTGTMYHYNNNASLDIVIDMGQTGSVSSTGNFTGTNVTAPSSVSSMGAIITYQDQAGTNALNTDIVLQLSADGGSNYTTATLEALPDFSTGIKMAKVNDLAVTAGTSLKYKISFANQSSGVKEARIRGVSLQY